MDGDIGFFTIKPDQMQVVNPLLILVFIPLYEVLFYPLLNFVGVRRPLQKITLGGVFAGVAFVCSMIVEIYLSRTYPVLPKSGEAQLRIFNGIDCDYTFNTNIPNAKSFNLPSNGYFEEKYVNVERENAFPYIATSSNPDCKNLDANFDLTSETATSYFITGTKSVTIIIKYEDDPEKSTQGTPLIRVLGNLLNTDKLITLRDKDDDQYSRNEFNRTLTDVPANLYEIIIGEQTIKKDIDLRLGGVYTILIQEVSAGSFVREVKEFTLNEVNFSFVSRKLISLLCRNPIR